MIKEELYNWTVGVLVDAYFKGEIEHGYCTACAVGNICMAAGAEFGFMSTPYSNSAWAVVFCTKEEEQYYYPEQYLNNSYGCKTVIDATGYTVEELAKIEYAFETAPKGESEDEWMFNGLMAVVDVLDQIHENTDTEVTQSTKNRFYESSPRHRLHRTNSVVRPLLN